MELFAIAYCVMGPKLQRVGCQGCSELLVSDKDLSVGYRCFLVTPRPAQLYIVR